MRSLARAAGHFRRQVDALDAEGGDGASPTILDLDGMAVPDAFAVVDASIDAALAAHVAAAPSAAAAAASKPTKGKKRRRRAVADETLQKVVRYDMHAARAPGFACAPSAAGSEKRESGKTTDRKGGGTNMMTVGLRAIGRRGGSSVVAAHDAVHQGEVLFRVAIFHPIRVAKAQEFVVLGRQKVTALFDHPSLFCLVDYMAPPRGGGDAGGSAMTTTTTTTTSSASSSSSSSSASASACAHVARSRTLFVGGVFYEDRRGGGGGAADAGSAEKRAAWLRAQGAGHVAVRSMEATTFAELDIQLGAHYVYTHGGGCSHVVSFVDARLAHGADVADAREYPMHVYQDKTRRRKCAACADVRAQLTCVGSAQTASPLTMLCEVCYVRLHYNADGALAPGASSAMRVYPYHCD